LFVKREVLFNELYQEVKSCRVGGISRMKISEFWDW
jgi:hypothetical protein